MKTFCDGGGINEVTSTQRAHNVGVDVSDTNLQRLHRYKFLHNITVINKFIVVLYN